MLFALLLALAAPNPLESVRLTPDQMFHLQFPYRYQVQIAEVVWHGAIGRFEVETTNYYANNIAIGSIRASAYGRGLATLVDLGLEDGVWFPEDRYQRFDSYRLHQEGTYLVTISDRQEHETLWPPKPASPAGRPDP